MSRYVHRVQCAAITRGCLNSLTWEDNLSGTRYVNERLLLLNGWRKDHGRWICANHPRRPAAEPEPQEAAR